MQPPRQSLSEKLKQLLLNLDQTRPYLYLVGLFSNWRECFVGFWHYLKLCFQAPPAEGKTVLVVEINAFHGETLPGFVHYFQELGYEVTVLTRYVSWKDSPFVRMPQKPRHFCLTIWGMKHFLKSPKAARYSVIFYNSLRLFLNEYRFINPARTFFNGKLPSGQDNWLGIEHNLEPHRRKELYQLLEYTPDAPALPDLQKHTFVLTPVAIELHTNESHPIPMLNPCYFGDLRPKQGFSAEGKRIFITIGNVSAKTRNFPELFKMLKEIGHEEGYELRIIGKIVDNSLLNEIPPNVRILGRLTFEEMYQQLEEADFFLPLLSPKEQAKYLDGCTSGSRQLILGFAIPPIIHQTFADVYGFREGSCLTHTDSKGFAQAFLRALSLSAEEYSDMRIALGSLRTEVEGISLANLRQRLQKQP